MPTTMRSTAIEKTMKGIRTAYETIRWIIVDGGTLLEALGFRSPPEVGALRMGGRAQRTITDGVAPIVRWVRRARLPDPAPRRRDDPQRIRNPST